MQIPGRENLNIPNSITSVRLVGVLYEAVQFGKTGNVNHLYKAGSYYGLDVLDGIAARTLHQETELGAAYDPFVDKASVAALGAAAIVQKDIDPLVAVAVGGINVSNVLATVVAGKRGTLDVHGVTDDAKKSQFWMNTGAGLNMIGNNLIKRGETSTEKMFGKVLRIGGGAIALTTVGTTGRRATSGFWHQALRSKS